MGGGGGLAAGALAVYVLNSKNILKRSEILNALGGRFFSWFATGLSINQLGFGWQGPGCFATFPKSFDSLPEYLKVLTYRGGHLVQTTSGGRMIFPQDPILLTSEQRYQMDDMVTISEDGFLVSPRGAFVPPGNIEVFQRPVEAGPCNFGIATSGRHLELSL